MRKDIDSAAEFISAGVVTVEFDIGHRIEDEVTQRVVAEVEGEKNDKGMDNEGNKEAPNLEKLAAAPNLEKMAAAIQ